MTTTTQTVREIALEHPSSIRVFEKYGIDYCCGGRKPLAEACAVGNLEVNAVIAALELAANLPAPIAADWAKATLDGSKKNMANEIINTDLEMTLQELP